MERKTCKFLGTGYNRLGEDDCTPSSSLIFYPFHLWMAVVCCGYSHFNLWFCKGDCAGYIKNTVLHGDCLELMKDIEDKSVDMILCDLPYGVTACKWDTIIPFEPLWEQYKRIIKDRGAIVLTATQPFASMLIMSNSKMYKYNWYWVKNKMQGFPFANFQPMRAVEEILVFSKYSSTFVNNGNHMVYNPQKIYLDKPYKRQDMKRKPHLASHRGNLNTRTKTVYDYKLPCNVLYFSNNYKGKQHPTQKPVDLFEYLIKTYTNEGDTVLDNCAGSGTTAIACINTNRNYILMEKEQEYIDIINKRIKEHTAQKLLITA